MGVTEPELGALENAEGDLILSIRQFDRAVLRNKYGFLAPKNANGLFVMTLSSKERIAFRGNTNSKSLGVKNAHQLDYPDAWPGASLQYIVGSTTLKENIIIPSNSAPTAYEFVLKCYGLTPRQSQNGMLEFVDSEEQVKAIMPSPYMKDANGAVSTSVHANITISGKRVSIGLTADAEWLNAAERAFPVILDPTVAVFTPTADAGISEYHDDTKLGSTELQYLDVGVYRGIFVPESRNWSLLRFDLRSLPTNTYIHSASLQMYCYDWNNNHGANIHTSHRVHSVAYSASTTWAESTVTWNNSGIESILASLPSDPNAAYLPNANGFWQKTVSPSLITHLLNNPSHSILMHTFCADCGYYRRFYSKDNSASNTYDPALTITFSHIPNVENVVTGNIAPENPELVSLGFKDKLRYRASWNTSFPYAAGFVGENFPCTSVFYLTNTANSTTTTKFATSPTGTSHSVEFFNSAGAVELIPGTSYSLAILGICLQHSCYDHTNPNTYKFVQAGTLSTNLSVSTYNWVQNPGVPVSSWNWSPLTAGHGLFPAHLGSVADFRYATDTDARGRVEYWPQGAPSEVRFVDEATPDGFRHTMRIAGLKWETYGYRVITTFPWDASSTYKVTSNTGTFTVPYTGPNVTVDQENKVRVTWNTIDSDVQGFRVTYRKPDGTQIVVELGPGAREHILSLPGFDMKYDVYVTAWDETGIESVSNTVTFYTLPEKAVLHSPIAAEGITGTLADGYRITVVFSQATAKNYRVRRFKKVDSTYSLEIESDILASSQLIAESNYLLPDGTSVPVYKFLEPATWTHSPHGCYRYEIVTLNSNPQVDTVTSLPVDVQINNNAPVIKTNLSDIAQTRVQKSVQVQTFETSDADADVLQFKYELIPEGETTPYVTTDWVASTSHTFSDIPTGQYTWRVSVNDAWVSEPVVKTGTLIANSAAPDITILSPSEIVSNGETKAVPWVTNVNGTAQLTLTAPDGSSSATNVNVVADIPQEFSFSPTVDGIYSLKIDVTDDLGNSGTCFGSLRKNVIPSITLGAQNVTLTKGLSYHFTLSVHDSDQTTQPDILWDFGDGTISTNAQPEHAFEELGTFTVVVSVTDSDEGQASTSMTVTVTNTSSGELKSSETWTDSWTITGDVVVPTGKILTIAAGAHIYFAGNFKITVKGTILVQGTSAQTVSFAPAGTFSGQWFGIHLSGATGSSIAYAQIQNCQYGLRIEDVGNLTISNVTVENGFVGLSVVRDQLTTLTIDISSCTFRDLDYGIHVYNSAPAINDCDFSDIRICGIKEDASGNPTVTNCEFSHPTTANTYAGDYYDEELTILTPEELGIVNPDNSGNTSL